MIFLGITIPVLLTFGPIFDYLSAPHRIGKAVSSVSIIVHVPILVSAIAVIEGWGRLRGRWGEVGRNLRAEVPQFATVGISLFAALAASDIMSQLGVGEQLNSALVASHLPKPLMILLVAILCIIVATPLSSTATAAAIGAPSVVALSALGVPPVVAVCTVLICTSTEGASPPVGAPIYLASGMAEVDPKETFVPLIVWFVVPIIAIAWLVGMGLLPIPH